MKTYDASPETVSEKESLVEQQLVEAANCFETDFRLSVRLAEEALTLSESINYAKGKAGSLLRLARCYLRLSDYPKVLESVLESIGQYRLTGDEKGEAAGLDTLGWVYNYLGDHESRLKSNLRCLELRRKSGDVAGEIGTMNNLGDTYNCLKQYENALDSFNKCLQHPQISERSRTIVLHNIGEVHFSRKEYEKAAVYFQQGLAEAIRLNYYSIAAVANIFLGEVEMESGNDASALAYFGEALRICTEQNLKDDVYRIHKNLSAIYEKQGKNELAFKHYRIFHETSESHYSQENIQRIKNIQFQHEAGLLRKETERERDRNLQLSKAYEQIEFQKTQITDSITYAKRLQDSMLPPLEQIKSFLPDSFVLYQPKDIVSGDFYWFERWGDKLLVGAVDCTGHGVPGAFLSIVGHNLLHQALHERGLSKPSLILNDVSKNLMKLLHQSESPDRMISDGMDAAIASIDFRQMQLETAGANNPVYLIRNGTLTVLPCDRFSVGAQYSSSPQLFASYETKLQPGDCLYFFTDGFADQFGGPKGKKFKYSQLKEKLLGMHSLPMNEQKEKLEKIFDDWRGKLEQVDDVLVIGVRI